MIKRLMVLTTACAILTSGCSEKETHNAFDDAKQNNNTSQDSLNQTNSNGHSIEKIDVSECANLLTPVSGNPGSSVQQKLGDHPTLEEYQNDLYYNYCNYSDTYSSASDFVKTIDISKYEYSFGYIIGQLNKNNIPYETYDYSEDSVKDHNDLFSDKAIILEDGTKLYFTDHSYDPTTGKTQFESAILKGQYTSNLWKINEEANYYELACNYEVGSILEKLKDIDFTASLANEYLINASPLTLYLARNYIFASHGYIFESKDLNGLFCLQDWYEPTYTQDEFNQMESILLTEQEKENVNLIKQLEEANKNASPEESSYTVKYCVNGSKVDIDQDGTMEQLWLFTNPEQNSTNAWVDLFVSEEDADGTITSTSIRFEDYYNTPYSTIGYVMGKQRIPYIILQSHVESGDYIVEVYSYKNNKLKKIATAYTGYLLDGATFDGDILELARTATYFECTEYPVKYKVTGNNFNAVAEDYHSYCPKFHIVLDTMNTYAENRESSSIQTLQKGDLIEIIGGDGEKWTQYINLTTNEKGYIYGEYGTIETGNESYEPSDYLSDLVYYN